MDAPAASKNRTSASARDAGLRLCSSQGVGVTAAVRRYQEALALWPDGETDAEWDWPPVGLLLDDGRLVVMQAHWPESYGPDWPRVLMLEEFPRVISAIVPERVGVLLNGTDDRGELLALMVADASDAEASSTRIGRRSDGVRSLGEWTQVKDVSGPWWEFMLALQRTLAAFQLSAIQAADPHPTATAMSRSASRARFPARERPTEDSRPPRFSS